MRTFAAKSEKTSNFTRATTAIHILSYSVKNHEMGGAGGKKRKAWNSRFDRKSRKESYWKNYGMRLYL